jgi:dihydroxyacetone kinase-like predicted kinase
MNSQNFDFKMLDDLSLKQQKKYLQRFFVPLKNGNHVLLENDTYEVYSQTDIKNTYFKRMPKELSTFYFEEYKELRSIVYELNKPVIFEDKLNLCPRIKHEYQEFSKFSEKVQKKVNIILSYIKDIICSKNEDSNQYVLKWLSNMMKGNKNNSCLYFRGEQGIGKSTLFQFIRDHILGKLFLECDSEPIRSRFNDILGGKLLVAFEELPTFSTF